MPIKSFDLASLESVSKILGDTVMGLKGTEITKFLSECDISDPGINSTKWKRLYDSLKRKQETDRCSNNVVAFIQHVMKPSRHYDNREWFDDTLSRLNRVLSFEGLELEQTGVVKTVSKTKTISEAEEKASNLKQSLLARKVHKDVLYFCKAELLVDNYFHTVFEATKSIAEKNTNQNRPYSRWLGLGRRGVFFQKQGAASSIELFAN